MKNIILNFQSMTYAIKAQKRLKNRGISSEVIKIADDKANNGCNYGLMIGYMDYYSTIKELKESGISFKTSVEGE